LAPPEPTEAEGESIDAGRVGTMVADKEVALVAGHRSLVYQPVVPIGSASDPTAQQAAATRIEHQHNHTLNVGAQWDGLRSRQVAEDVDLARRRPDGKAPCQYTGRQRIARPNACGGDIHDGQVGRITGRKGIQCLSVWAKRQKGRWVST